MPWCQWNGRKMVGFDRREAGKAALGMRTIASDEEPNPEVSQDLPSGWCKAHGPTSKVSRKIPGAKLIGTRYMFDPSFIFLHVNWYGLLQARTHRSVVVLPMYSFSLTHHFSPYGLAGTALCQIIPPYTCMVHGWHCPIIPNPRVCDVTLEFTSCFLQSQHF